MNPEVVEIETGPGTHNWKACINSCDIDDASDRTLLHMVHAVREAYGEGEILAVLNADPAVIDSFDLGAVVAAIRQSLPNPAGEGAKPKEGLKCAVQRRCLSAGANPARQLSLRPEAIGATVEVTKPLKPSV